MAVRRAFFLITLLLCVGLVASGCNFLFPKEELNDGGQPPKDSDPPTGPTVVFQESFDNPDEQTNFLEGWARSDVSTVYVDTDDAYQGEGSLYVEDASDEVYDFARSVRISVESDTDYTFTVWSKTDDLVGDGSYITVLIEQYDAEVKRQATTWWDMERTLDWKENTLEMTTRDDTQSIIVIFYAAARSGGVQSLGKAWFDEFTITKGD